MAAPDSVDAYLEGFPPDARATLQHIRATIHAAIPDAGEAISYGIPTFTFEGRSIVFVAGWKRHVSVYPTPPADPDLDRRLAPYRHGAGTLRFKLAEPIPEQLIADVARRLMAQRRSDVP